MIRASCDARTVKRRSGRPSHGPPSPRRGTASPPPTGSGDHGGSLGGGETAVKDFFQKPRTAELFACLGRSCRPNAAGAPFDQAPPGASVIHWLRFLRPTWIS